LCYECEHVVCSVNPLNAELNSIFHSLVLLDLMFMGPCIVSIFQYTCISNKTQRYTVYLYLETTLHVSGGTFTHHQEQIHLYLQHLVFVTPLLLSAAIVEELEPTGLSVLWVAYATYSTLKPVPTLYIRCALSIEKYVITPMLYLLYYKMSG
jgi:hypothetical protein